jgi:hypothetical protein
MIEGSIIFNWVFISISIISIMVLISWISHRPERGLYLAFFASGILITPTLPVVRDKFAATEIIILITWLALLMHGGQKLKAPILLRHQKISILLAMLFIFWTILSFGLNNMTISEFSIPSMVETFNFFYGFLIFVTTLKLARNKISWHNSLNWWVAGSAVVIFFGAWGMIGGAPGWVYEDFTGRISSTLRNENQVPSYLLPIFVVTVFMAVKRGANFLYKYILWGLVLGSLVTAVGTGSRTAILMILVAFVGVGYVTVRSSRYSPRPYSISAIGNMLLLLVGSLILYVSVALVNYEGDYALGRTPAWQRPVVMLYDWYHGYTVLDRTRIDQLDAVAEYLEDNLLIGTGPKVYGNLYQIAEIHNTYAGVALQTGIIGLILFLFWLFHLLIYSLYSVTRISDPWEKVMVLSLVVGMMTLLVYSMTMFGLRQRTIWLLSGLLAASWSLVPRKTLQFEPINNTLNTERQDPSIVTAKITKPRAVEHNTGSPWV